MAEALWLFCCDCFFWLEVELRSELDDTAALLLGRRTEVRIRLGDDFADRILLELQGQVAATRERIQWVIEEVVRLCTDLNLHSFGQLEILEDTQI